MLIRYRHIILLLLVFNSIALSSQSKINYGVKGGVNLAKLGGDFDETKARTSFYLGGIVSYKFSESFELQTELLYSQIGMKQAEISLFLDEAMQGVYYKWKLNQLQVPLVVKYFPNFLKNKAYLEFGLYYGVFLTKEHEKRNVSLGTIENAKADYLNTQDLGFDLGFGYRIKDRIEINCRYFEGSDLYKKSNDTYYGGVIYNSVWQFGLSLRL